MQLRSHSSYHCPLHLSRETQQEASGSQASTVTSSSRMCVSLLIRVLEGKQKIRKLRRVKLIKFAVSMGIIKILPVSQLEMMLSSSPLFLDYFDYKDKRQGGTGLTTEFRSGSLRAHFLIPFKGS